MRPLIFALTIAPLVAQAEPLVFGTDSGCFLQENGSLPEEASGEPIFLTPKSVEYEEVSCQLPLDAALNGVPFSAICKDAGSERPYLETMNLKIDEGNIILNNKFVLHDCD